MVKYISVDDLRAATTKRNKIWNTITDASGRGLDEIIDSLPSANEKSFEWCNGCKEYDQSAHCCHRWTKAIRNTVEELRNESQWIPCSERMPEINTYVLATTVWGDVTIAERLGAISTYDNYDWFTCEGNNNAENEDILAWMPLPEPYKEGD